MAKLPMDPAPLRQAFADHTRQWERFTLVYPVISRRSRGLSIGINLNPDTVCNFNCTYCCVDRKSLSTSKSTEAQSHDTPRPAASLQVIEMELDAMLAEVASGEIWKHPRFADVPQAYRRVNDIAFSGDGEPTTSPLFPAAVDLVKTSKQRHGLNQTRLVVITNASMLHRPDIEEALSGLHADVPQGEVWAKLDAGTQSVYQRINRSSIPYQRILENITRYGQRHDLTIQTMLLKENGQPPTEAFIDAYMDRIDNFLKRGCRIKAIQLYTIARQTAESNLRPLDLEQLEVIASEIRERFGSLSVETFG